MGGTDAHLHSFFNLGTRWRRVVTFMSQPFLQEIKLFPIEWAPEAAWTFWKKTKNFLLLQNFKSRISNQ
jgi:hypothetical protein